MPAKNVLKSYVEGGYYHIYNRGVNKRTIFMDEQDYAVFLSYLKLYLLPKDEKALKKIIADSNATYKEKEKAEAKLHLNNFNSRIELIAYCLMPNHFHFLLKQVGEKDMEIFMRSVGTKYTMYFNRKYKRVGPLFQDTYKAVLMKTDAQILYLTRYIHRNPIKKINKKRLTKPSFKRILLSWPMSYQNYLGLIRQDWVKPEFILQNFSESGFNSYEEFVESDDSDDEVKSAYLLKDVTLD